MAAALPQDGFYPRLEGRELFQRDKGLGGAPKAAAMDPNRPFPLQKALRQGDGEEQLLLFPLSGGHHVLEVEGGGAARFPNQAEEPGDVPFPEGLGLLGGPAVFPVKDRRRLIRVSIHA